MTSHGAEISIRPMTVEDLDRIAEIEKTSFSLYWYRTELAAEFESDKSKFIVAAASGDIVGYAALHLEPGSVMVSKVAVDPEHRRKGVALLLLEDLLEVARSLDAPNVWLSVRASNTAALQLYDKLGFEKRSVEKGYYTDTSEDALVLVKRILYVDSKNGIDGAKLRAARMKFGYSLEDLAKENCPARMLEQIETGKARGSQHLAVRLAESMRLPVECLLQEGEKETHALVCEQTLF